MKTHPITAAFCLLTLTFPACADTFIMKDGSKVEGTLLREDATTYVLEVRVTKSIKDERSLSKADVKSIERETPRKNDFEPISKLIPTPDVLTAAEYAPKVALVEKYLAEHRMMATTKDAQAVLDTLKAEASEISAGGIKLQGVIVSAATRKTNAYEIDARIQEAKIRQLVKDMKNLQALRAFSECGRDFPNTSAYNDLIPMMQQVMTAHLAEVSHSLATLNARAKERRAGLERMPAADRRKTETAIREEAAELNAQFQTQMDAKIDWVTPHPFCRAALEATVAFGNQELARLSASKQARGVDGGKAFRDAMTMIQNQGDAAQIKAAIATAKAAMVPARYLAMLTTPPTGETKR